MGDIADWINDLYVERYYNEKPEPMILTYRQIKFESKKAYLIEFEMCEDLSTVEAWIPKSQSTLLRGHRIEIEAWIVEEKELEAYSV